MGWVRLVQGAVSITKDLGGVAEKLNPSQAAFPPLANPSQSCQPGIEWGSAPVPGCLLQWEALPKGL